MALEFPVRIKSKGNQRAIYIGLQNNDKNISRVFDANFNSA